MTRATVVLSGGQDSTTCLALAMARGYEVDAISFDYGQRHIAELHAASKIASSARVPHRVLNLLGLRDASSKASSLTDHSKEVSTSGGFGGLPSTFVPGRNLVFLSLAASHALSNGSRVLFTGVCQTDYSGYPDCRRDTIDAMEKAINLGNGIEDFSIETPLMNLTKADTVKIMYELSRKGTVPLAWELLGMSLTCYNGFRPGCGECPACVLRKKGFQEAGHRDPAEENRLWRVLKTTC